MDEWKEETVDTRGVEGWEAKVGLAEKNLDYFVPPLGVTACTSKHEHAHEETKLGLVRENQNEPDLFWLEPKNQHTPRLISDDPIKLA
jgi:hypothetical protein